MLVSVIIPTYNHARFLPDAIGSAKNQDHPHVEIIVVDDGSTDCTPSIMHSMEGVTYIRQENAGLSAARNTGFANSTGQFVVFLDADDLLYPTALSSNLHFLENDTQLAFVSGCHNMIDVEGFITDNSSNNVTEPYYTELLRRNYIGMNGAVMYTRKTIEEIPFDTSLRACEDYDQYLRTTRHFKVKHHHGKIAAYRIHQTNMSSDPALMLAEVTKVLSRQKQLLRSVEEKQAFEEGMQNWKGKYLPKLYESIFERKTGSELPDKYLLLIKYWFPLLKIFVRRRLAFKPGLSLMHL